MDRSGRRRTEWRGSIKVVIHSYATLEVLRFRTSAQFFRKLKPFINRKLAPH